MFCFQSIELLSSQRNDRKGTGTSTINTTQRRELLIYCSVYSIVKLSDLYANMLPRNWSSYCSKRPPNLCSLTAAPKASQIVHYADLPTYQWEWGTWSQNNMHVHYPRAGKNHRIGVWDPSVGFQRLCRSNIITIDWMERMLKLFSVATSKVHIQCNMYNQ